MSFNKITDCSVAILAGGKNSRYGGFHKAFLRIDDKLLIQRDIDLLSTIFEEVIIIANQVEIFSRFGVAVYQDVYHERGPLAGIHSALSHIKNEAALIVGCDMPYLNKEMIMNIYERYKSSESKYCIPTKNGLIEPLHGIYSKKSLNTLTRFLDREKFNAIHRFLKEQKVDYLEIDFKEEAFLNINSPEDLAKLN